MFEPKMEWNRAILDAPAREAIARKAKADRLAWQSAEFLASGRNTDALGVAQQGAALVGHDNFTARCKHYATEVFRVPLLVARDFMKSIVPLENGK